MTSILDKILWKIGLKGPIPSPPVRDHPKGPYAALHNAPRHQPACIKLLNQDFQIADGFSFYWMYQEIFIDGVYDIKASDPEPSIIDCGASYGVSALYFKSRFPQCTIKAVEADPTTFSLLAANIKHHNFSGVTLLNKAVAAESNLNVPFYSLGADIGRLHGGPADTQPVLVPTISLDDLIDGPTDFLKIDIEGAETEVLRSTTKLHLVKQVFVEYHSFKETDQSLGELLNILRNNCFRYYIHAIYTPSRPFIEQKLNHSMDMQLAISATRLF